MRKDILAMAFVWVSSVAWAQSDSMETVESPADSLMQTLPEVMVRGEHPLVKSDGSKLIFDVQRLIKDKPVDNAFDALKELPGVVYQNDDVTLGGMPVSIILNGRLTTMSREQLLTLLKTTPAARVQKVEVMYSAPARYQVRGALINIVLGSAGGMMPLQGEAFAKAESAHEMLFNERLSLQYNKDKLSLDMVYGVSHGKGFYTMDKEGVHTLADGSRYDVLTNEVIRAKARPSHNYRVGMDYDFAKNHQLGIAYTGSYSDFDQRNSMTGMQLSNVHNTGDDILHNGHLDYTLPIGLNIGADITYYEDNVTQDLVSNLLGSQLDFISSTQQRINRTKLFAREEHGIGKKSAINYGVVYTYIIDHSRQGYEPTGDTTTDQLPADLLSRRTERTLNIYAGGNHRFSDKLSMELSFAAEHSKTTMWNEWDYYPTLNISYMPKPGRIWQLSFSSDKSYPDFWAMQDATSFHGGRYEEIVGNPLLKPSKQYSAGLMHVLNNKYIFRGWYNYTKDRCVQTMYQARNRFVEIDQYQNFDFQQQAGLMGMVPLTVSWWWNARLTVMGVWMREKDSDYYDCPFDREIAYGMCNGSSTFKLSRKRDLSLTLSGFVRTKAYQGTMDLPASGNLDINLRYAFSKGNAILNLYCNDIFETQMITPVCRWAGQDLKTTFSCFRTFGLSLTYRFGGYKAKQIKEVDMSRMKKS